MTLTYTQKILIGRVFLNNPLVRRFSVINICNKSAVTSDSLTERPESFVDEDEIAEKKRVNTNKSRLLPHDRNILHQEKPYNEPKAWFHLTEKYQRKLYALYGEKSGINPRICFPMNEDILKRAEYEKVAYPYTLQEMMEKAKKAKEEKRLQIQKREEEIALKIVKLEQWKAELKAKTAKKEAEAQAAKEKKERLVEEVRRHFGFKVDPRDERFKALLEQKEKEDKRKQKEAKRKAKEEKMMAKLLDSTSTAKADEKTGIEKSQEKTTEN